MRLPRLVALLCFALPGIATALPAGGWHTERLNAREDKLSIANAINNLGRIVGTVLDDDESRHAVIFEGDGVRRIGTLGGLQSEANALGPRGEIAGSAQIDNGYWHAYVRPLDGHLQDLGTLGGHNSTAMAVNSAGQAAGYADTTDQQWHAFFYDQGRMRDLGTLGGHFSAAMGMNKYGQVVGMAENGEGRRHAFLYTVGGGMRDLGTLGGRQSVAYGINDQGQIVGVSETKQHNWHAFIYRNDKMEDLGAMLEHGSSTAVAINNLGQILGTHSQGYRRTFVYAGPDEVRYLSGETSLYQPKSMNDGGDIVGGFLMLSKVRAAILRAVSVPPPVAQLSAAQILALLLAALLAAWILQRRLLDWWRPQARW